MNLPPPKSMPLRDHHIDYAIKPMSERFFVYFPPHLTGDGTAGLIVFMDPGNSFRALPPGWAEVLDKRNLMFVCPDNAGNDVPVNRRLGLAVYAALGIEQRLKIDKNRVYAAGFSGGARMAGLLGFYSSNIFKGSIQMCGADFYESVPDVLGKPQPQDSAAPYGLMEASPSEIAAAKQNFRFVLLTGSTDFRHGQIVDIYDGGFQKNGFHSALIDVPDMGHAMCPPRRINEAIDFLENVKSADGTGSTLRNPPKPAWISQDTGQWPQILLHNHIVDKTGQGDAGSAALARLPNGIVLMFTAGHIMGDVPPEQFTTAYTSWSGAVEGSHGTGVLMSSVAVDPSTVKSRDTLVLCPRSQYETWPATVLPVRTQPLEIGDRIYLITVPFGSSTRQNVYPGEVVDRGADGHWLYNIEGSFKTSGSSGAPVIDEFGQLAAVNLGHLGEQNIPGKLKLYGQDVADLIPLLKLPSSLKPPVKHTPHAAVVTPAATGNAKADEALHAAQLYVDNKMPDAKTKLQSVITDYPGTDAALKARQLLKTLTD